MYTAAIGGKRAPNMFVWPMPDGYCFGYAAAFAGAAINGV